MLIYTVKSGDTVYSIAANYGVSTSSLIINNGLDSPPLLAVGQSLVILIPSVTYTVQSDDTLESIARQFDTSVIQIMRNNLILEGQFNIYPGQTLIIEYEDDEYKYPGIVNGYSYAYIQDSLLRVNLPFLSYITPFTYGFDESGNIIDLNDEKILTVSSEYNVSPIMLMSTLTKEGRFNNQLSNIILNNLTVQDNFIKQVIDTMLEKGYMGLEIDFEYVFPYDAQAYSDFIARLNTALDEYGYPVFVALAPKTSPDQPGLLYEAHRYGELGAAADRVLLMTYEWGYTFGPPQAVAPIDKVREVVEYALTEIPANKILLGIPNYGYDWILPFVRGDGEARSLSNLEAIQLAIQTNSVIEFDEVAQSPYFYYTDYNGREHVVWFEDARSINAKFNLVEESMLAGIGIWNIMRRFPALLASINSRFEIVK